MSSIPIASGTTRMSLKRMAASTPRMSTGCSETCAASSGDLHRSRNFTFSRTARYSGRYRPACRMIQTGVRLTGFPKQASIKIDISRALPCLVASSLRISRAVDPKRSAAAGYLLQLEGGLAAFEDPDGAAGLGDRDGDRARLHRDGRGRCVSCAKAERQFHLAFARLQIPAGGEHHAVFADDEGAVEYREVLDRLANARVEDVALGLADALERVERQLLAILHHHRGVAEHEDGADGVAFEAFVADGHGQGHQRLDHLRAELRAQALGVNRRFFLEPAADLQPHHGVVDVLRRGR